MLAIFLPGRQRWTNLWGLLASLLVKFWASERACHKTKQKDRTLGTWTSQLVLWTPNTYRQVLVTPHTHCGRVDTHIHTVRWHSAKALASYSSSSVFNFLVTNLQEVNLFPVYSNRVSLFCLCCPGHYNSLASGSHIAETKVCTHPCAKLNVCSFKVLKFEDYWDDSVATGSCWQAQYSVSLGPTW